MLFRSESELPDWHILHAKARRHSWAGEGWLSIKTFPSGHAHYSVGAGHHAVDHRSYLLLNHGRHYAIEIESRTPVESFCIFFNPAFAADAFRNAVQTPDQLLEATDASAPVNFFEKNYSHDRIVSPLLRKLRNTHRLLPPGELEESMHLLAAALLRVHRLALREADELKSVRVVTRRELYRRAARARDFTEAMFSEPIALADIAKAAALSPNHLLRVFPQIYHQTPHQFLTNRRLTEATRLLVNTESSITDICLAVGFESLGSFCSLFRRRFGMPPSEYRRAKR
jgi:AraC family transcriptional regulator